MPDFVDEIGHYLKLTVKNEGEGFSSPIFRAFSKNRARGPILKCVLFYFSGGDARWISILG